MIDDIRPGDARELFARLARRFTTMTTGAISALTSKCNTLTMENTGKSVEEFAYFVRTHFERLMLVTGRKDCERVKSLSLCLCNTIEPFITVYPISSISSLSRPPAACLPNQLISLRLFLTYGNDCRPLVACCQLVASALVYS